MKMLLNTDVISEKIARNNSVTLFLFFILQNL